MIARPRTPTPADAARIREIAAGAADRSRIGALDLAARLNRGMAEAARLEAARLRFKHGAGAEPAEDPGRSAESLARSYQGRADAAAAEATQANQRLRRELERDQEPPGGTEPFRVEVSVLAGKQPVPGVQLELLRNEETLKTATTDQEGRAVFEIEVAQAFTPAPAPSRRSDFVSIGRGKTAPSTQAARAGLFVLARDTKGKIIARAPVDAVIEPGGTAQVTLQISRGPD